MIKLYGAPLSNYYNMIKTAMIEKNIPFEEVLTPPSQDEEYLSKSPMGKIPCIKTEHGFLAESLAILEYLEEQPSDVTLLPGDAFQRAKVRELAQSLELHIELVARQGFGVLRGKEVPAHVVEVLQRDLPKGCKAVARLVNIDPFIAGSELTFADIVAYFTFILANKASKAVIDLDLLEAIPGASTWYDMISERASIKSVLADQKQ